ncbi:Phospholipid hydroperoxide glutathione peroxidase, partial [Phytophthora palmivora]
MSTEGIIQAGNLLRKRVGLLAMLTCGKQLVYVEANDKHKNVTVFESETNKATPLATVDVSTDATVEFDASMTHGIKLANAKSTEVFAAESKEKQEEWLNSFINAG